MIISEKWDLRFLELAQLVSKWSLDPSTRVGCVIVDPDKRIVSTGYNGFPQGVLDNERYLDRDLKNQLIVHAEINGILFAGRPLKGCTLYTYPFQPCSKCAGAIINSGIKNVVSMVDNNPRWAESFKLARTMFDEAGIHLHLYPEGGL